MQNNNINIDTMSLVFKALTAHMENWKLPFQVFCNEDEKELYVNAIIFHVGGNVVVQNVTKERSAARYLLITPGYYKNIGA